jgi:hypothetical protein
MKLTGDLKHAVRSMLREPGFTVPAILMLGLGLGARSSRAEAAWADAFRKALCDEFHVRTGEDVTVWQDSQSLRVGQKWASEIEEGIRNAAAFLAVVSPSYLNSPWCRQERAIVLEKKLEALKVESFYRLLKVIKTPGPGNAHEELLGVLHAPLTSF